jgi:DNA replication protein DnaC
VAEHAGREGAAFDGRLRSGKTHLAVAALVEIINSGKPGRLVFSNFQDLIQEIQSSFDADTATTKARSCGRSWSRSAGLDELGSQKPTQFVQDILYYVINTRYNEERATIFTTNYYDRSADAKEETLEQRIGTRLRSRLAEMASAGVRRSDGSSAEHPVRRGCLRCPSPRVPTTRLQTGS